VIYKILMDRKKRKIEKVRRRQGRLKMNSILQRIGGEHTFRYILSLNGLMHLHSLIILLFKSKIPSL